VKSFYLRNLLRYVDGPTIDFGCGAGQLLERLPPGSIGFEVNPALVRALQAAGLNAVHYDAAADRFSLGGLAEHRYSTFVMAHVLEHFADAAQVLRTLLRACRRLEVRRFVLVVPGWKGYLSDATHRTFVDWGYLQREGLLSCEGFELRCGCYFPLNCEAIGNYFVYHELMVVFQRQASGSAPSPRCQAASEPKWK